MTMTNAQRLDRLESMIQALLDGQQAAVPPVPPTKAEPKAEKAVQAKMLPGFLAPTKKGHNEVKPNKGAKVGAEHFGLRSDKKGVSAHTYKVAEGPDGLYYAFVKA